MTSFQSIFFFFEKLLHFSFYAELQVNNLFIKIFIPRLVENAYAYGKVSKIYSYLNSFTIQICGICATPVTQNL